MEQIYKVVFLFPTFSTKNKKNISVTVNPVGKLLFLSNFKVTMFWLIGKRRPNNRSTRAKNNYKNRKITTFVT